MTTQKEVSGLVVSDEGEIVGWTICWELGDVAEIGSVFGVDDELIIVEYIAGELGRKWSGVDVGAGVDEDGDVAKEEVGAVVVFVE